MKNFSKPTGFSKHTGTPRTRATYAAMRRDSDRPLELFKAECNACHKLCEVPFKPNGKKPVYCRDCYRANEGGAPERSASFSPRGASASTNTGDFSRELVALGAKIERLTAAVEAQTRALTSK